MKKLLLALCITTITMSTTCSKEDDIMAGNSQGINTSQVPAAVMGAFTSRYPAATGQIEWEREDGNTYKVKFFIGSQRMQAIFAANGGFISEKQI